MSQYWDESLHIFQHTFQVRQQTDFGSFDSDAATAFGQPVNMPVYQEDHSSHTDVDFKLASENGQLSHNDAQDGETVSKHSSFTLKDTCRTENCEAESSFVHSEISSCVQLKIVSFNVWNTNVVRGGNKEYISRMKQIAQVGSRYVQSTD